METAPPSIIDTIDRLRVVSSLGRDEFLDLLGLTWPAYTLFKMGVRELPETALDRLAMRLEMARADILGASVDFHGVQRRVESGRIEFPQRYLRARHGRARTTITSFDYLERRYGWRLRFDALRRLNMGEESLVNEFAPVAMAFITDLCSYLRSRQFGDKDFFAMGAFSYDGNANTILAELLSRERSSKEVLELMWGECLPLLERNCIYRFLRLDDDGGLLEVVSDPHVASEAGVRHLGNQYVCMLKAGMMSTGPCYIGDIPASVRETRCVHKGDSSCQFEIKLANRNRPYPAFNAS